MIIPISYFSANNGQSTNIVSRVQNLYSNGETNITIKELEKSYTNAPESQLQMIQDVSHYFELMGEALPQPQPELKPKPQVQVQAQPQQAAKITEPEPADKSKYSLSTAAILCFFFGGFGIHRFYVGKIGTGFAMLCLWCLNLLILIATFVKHFGVYDEVPITIYLFLVGGINVWVWVDFIMILCGAFRDKDDKRLTR